MINENLKITQIDFLEMSMKKYNDAPCGEEDLKLQAVIFDIQDVLVNQDETIKDQQEEIKKMKEMIFGLYAKIETLSK